MEGKLARIGILDIVASSLQLTFNNILEFLKYFAYPVLGMFFGILIAITPALILPSLYTAADKAIDTGALVSILLGLVLGLCLFCHAFWIYLVRSASSFLIAYNLIKNETLMDLKEADESITKRAGSYVVLLLLQFIISLAITLLIIFPLLLALTKNTLFVLIGILGYIAMIPLCIYLLYHFVLSTAAFALNQEISAVDAIKKSCGLTHNKIFKTFLLLLLLSIILSAVMALSYIPIIGLLILPLYCILTPPLTALVVTYWYLRLEEEIANPLG